MKKFLAIAAVLGTTMALGACAQGELGYVDTAPPYTQERTASGPTAAPVMKKAPVRYQAAERTFTRVQSK